jgi:hypothetical protein
MRQPYDPVSADLHADADAIRGRLADLPLIRENLLAQVLQSRLHGQDEHQIRQLLEQYDQLASPDTP